VIVADYKNIPEQNKSLEVMYYDGILFYNNVSGYSYLAQTRINNFGFK